MHLYILQNILWLPYNILIAYSKKLLQKTLQKIVRS